MVMLSIKKDGDLLCLGFTSGNASSIWQIANCISSLMLFLLALSREIQC